MEMITQYTYFSLAREYPLLWNMHALFGLPVSQHHQCSTDKNGFPYWIQRLRWCHICHLDFTQQFLNVGYDSLHKHF